MATDIKKIVDMDPAGTLDDADMLVVRQAATTGGRKLTLSALLVWLRLEFAGAPLTVAEGGTGSATQVGARTNLGLGTMATQNASNVAITGGTIAGLTSLTMGNTGSVDINVSSYGNTVTPLLTGRRARGTLSVPATVQTGDNLLTLRGQAYGATGFTGTVAEMYFEVAQTTPSDSAMGTALVLRLAPLGTVSVSTALRVSHDAGIEYRGAAIVDTNRLPIARSYTVATLPTPGTVGRMAWASNGRAYNGTGTLEGAGAGTGVLVVDNGSNWKVAGTNQNVLA